MKKRAIAIILILILCVTGAVAYRSVMKTLYPHKYADIVEKYSAQYDVDADLIYAGGNRRHAQGKSGDRPADEVCRPQDDVRKRDFENMVYEVAHFLIGIVVAAVGDHAAKGLR